MAGYWPRTLASKQQDQHMHWHNIAGANGEDDDDDDDETCGFCRFMKAGGCKTEFTVLDLTMLY